jgi:hypothetical protein
MIGHDLKPMLERALHGLDWSAGVSRRDLIARTDEGSVSNRLLALHLPEGAYFSVADVATAIPVEIARDPARWAIAVRKPDPAPDQFEGITPEGLGMAIRAAAGEFAQESGWLTGRIGAALRSSILPGWGQWYNRQPEKGIAFGVVALLCALASAARGRGRALWFALLATTYLASMADAYVNGKG